MVRTGLWRALGDIWALRLRRSWNCRVWAWGQVPSNHCLWSHLSPQSPHCAFKVCHQEPPVHNELYVRRLFLYRHCLVSFCSWPEILFFLLKSDSNLMDLDSPTSFLLVHLHITQSVFSSDTFPSPVHGACLWTVMGACVGGSETERGRLAPAEGLPYPEHLTPQPPPLPPKTGWHCCKNRKIFLTAVQLPFGSGTFSIVGWGKHRGQGRCPWHFAGSASLQCFCQWFMEQSSAT